MTQKPLIPRARATRDVYQIVEYYEAEAGAAVADRFAIALAEAYRHLSSYPGSGSPLLGEQLRRAGLRTWPLAGFPHLVFLF